MFRKFLTTGTAALALALGVNDSDAATRTWLGGNNNWDANALNWSGFDEPDPDDDAVFNNNDNVDMTIDNEVQSLDLSGSITLNTSDQFLDVNGDITLAGVGTNLRVGENNLLGLPATSLSAYNITVGADATFQNANFTSYIHPSTVGVFNINSGGTLYGNGTIRNGDGMASPTVVLSNDGVIRPGNVQDLIVIGGVPAARTLTLAAIDGEARIDLDGVGGSGSLDIQRNQTLDIDIEVNDDFDGVIDMTHNATLDIEDEWEFAGTLNVDNGFVASGGPLFPSIPADVAFLQGGAILMDEATTTINVLDSDGTLQFDAQLTANDGTINNSGQIIFNQNATINASVDFQMDGVDAGMTVGSGVTVTINDDDMDFDGSGASTNVITVESGGRLDMNLDSFEGNDRADGFFVLNSGRLDLTVTDGSWTMDRRLILNNSTGTNPQVTGSSMVVGDDVGFNGSPDADVRVEGTGSSQINVPVTWNSDTEVDVDSDATLAVLGFSTFNSVNGAESAQFDGPGNIFFSGGQVNEATTLNFSGGTVGLDGGGALVILLSAPNFTLDAPLTINAAELADYGRTVAFPLPDSSVLTINNNVGGRLDVNLDDANDSWTVNDVGIMDVDGTAIGYTTFLTGNRLRMEGTMNVDGFSRSTAPITFGSTAQVNMNDASVSLRLNGGDLVNANLIVGGTIDGPGEISASNGRALRGHGTINANIDFDGATSELLANDGTLLLTGAIQDVGIIGTADGDGVLNVTSAWTTSDTDQVRLDGGQIRGATITNDGAGGINGAGLVSARVINETVVTADVGATLILDTALNNNNWDGLGNAGALRAINGSTLEVNDNSTFLFQGSVEANNGTVRSDGFELEFEPGSSLTLANGGRYTSTTATDIGGTVQVNAGATSRIQVPGTVVFESTSATTLIGNLELDNAATTIESGATFAGGGALQNPNGSTLQLLDGADVDVLIENSGILELGSSPGQTTGLDFQQNADGTWDVELGGLGLSDFDRMTLTGAASLDGTLDLSLIGGYTPALGDTLTILSATGGIAGAFASILQPATMPADLMFDVNNLGSILQLEVVDIPAFTADFDMDGDVDADDLAQWEGDYGMNGDSDADGDGLSSGFDFLAWQQQNGSGVVPVAALGATAVPEPTSLLLTGLVVFLGAAAPIRRRLA